MNDELVAAGGICASPDEHARFRAWWAGDDIWPNRITTLRGLRRFFAWERGWGFPLRGGPHPKLRDALPMFRTVRGGIRFERVP